MKQTIDFSHELIQQYRFLRGAAEYSMFILQNPNYSLTAYDEKTGLLLIVHGGSIELFGPSENLLGDLEKILERYDKMIRSM